MFSVARWVTGHDDLVMRNPERLYLQCQACGRETSGWSLRAVAVNVNDRSIEKSKRIGAARCVSKFAAEATQ